MQSSEKPASWKFFIWAILSHMVLHSLTKLELTEPHYINGMKPVEIFLPIVIYNAKQFIIVVSFIMQFLFPLICIFLGTIRAGQEFMEWMRERRKS